MKLSVLSPTQRGAGLVLWLVVGLILAVGVAATVLFLPKLKTPRQATSRTVVRSKIPQAPATGKIQAPPPKPAVQKATAPATPAVTGGASLAKAKADEQSSMAADKHAAPPAPAKAADKPALAKTKAEQQTSPPVDKPTTTAKVSAKTAEAPTTKSPSDAAGAKETTVPNAGQKAPQATQDIVKPQGADEMKQVAATVKPLEPKPLPAKAQPIAAPAQTSSSAVPETRNQPEPSPASSAKAETAQQLPMKAQKALLPPASTAPFTIQFGAFRTKAYADKLLDELQKRGYTHYIADKIDATNQTIYMVRMGRFQTRAEVVDALDRFKEKENMTAVIALTKNE